MTPVGRWCAVAVGTVVLAALPLTPRLLPAADVGLSAAGLLARVQASSDAPWSGYVEAVGTLQLPDAGRFSDLAALFGSQVRLRAWSADADHWRVDRLLATGEDDLVHDGGTTTEWDYERARATVSRDPDIRLPRSADLVPPALAHRFLRGVRAGDVTRLAARRVAGVDAPGLRVTPPAAISSIDHLDLWADPDNGVPLRVVVYADDDRAAFTSAFRDFSADRPSAAEVAFTPTASTEVRHEDVLDIADAANQYAPLVPPDSAAGLAKSSASDGAVGVYGQGMAQVIAIPLRGREADALRAQLAVTPGVEQLPDQALIVVGPLGVVITGRTGERGWLVAGTVNRDALVRAGDDVASWSLRLDASDS